MIQRVERVPQLDLLRGLAVLLMIINHAAIAWFAEGPMQEGTRVATFLGSLAPILFFYVTGLGIGITTAATGPGPWKDTLFKSALLFVADWFLHPTFIEPLQLDFFGFIAVSMLVVQVLLRTSKPILWAGIGSVMAVVMRYGIGPKLDGVEGAAWLFGTRAIPGFSYWIVPWICYPLLGFMAGRMLYPTRIRQLRWALALGFLVLVSAAVTLAWRGMPVFRWGTISFAYFVASLAAIPFASLAGELLLTTPLARVSIRGIGSFVAVPLHYTLVHLLSPLMSWGADVARVLCLLLFAMFVLRAADLLGGFLQQSAARLQRQYPHLPSMMWVFVVGCAALSISFSWWPMKYFAQLLICLMLCFRLQAKAQLQARPSQQLDATA